MAGETFDLDLVGSLSSVERRRRADRARPAVEQDAGHGALPPRARARGALRATCRGCAGARCTGRSPRRSKPTARRAARSPRTGSAPATATARATRCCGRRRVGGRPRLPRRRRGRPPGARPVARGRRRGTRASTRSSATAAAPSWRASSPRRRRAWRELAATCRDGDRAVARARSAGWPPCYDLRGRARATRSRRASRRPTASPRTTRAPTRRSSGSRWPTTCASARRTARRWCWRAAPEPRPSEAGRLDLRLRALGLEGMARAKRGDVRGRARDRARRRSPLALEHDMTGRRRRALPAAERRPLRRRGLPGRAEEALDTALGLCEASARRGRRVGVRDLPGLRAARARRLGAAPPRWAAS